MPYVSAHGVDTCYETVGAGQAVVLLHGGFCSLEMMRGQADHLSDRFAVWAPERPGHGRTADRDAEMSYAQGMADTLSFLDAVGIDRAHVVGFSDGAVIALLLALPQRLRSVVAISANLAPHGVVHSDDEVDPAADAEPDEDGERLRFEYDALSPDGPQHGEVVLEKLLHLWRTGPDIDPASLASIALPTMIMAADRDLIRPEHTQLIADSIPGARLLIVPGATHMLLVEHPHLVNLVLGGFLDAAAQH